MRSASGDREVATRGWRTLPPLVKVVGIIGLIVFLLGVAYLLITFTLMALGQFGIAERCSPGC